MSPWGAIGLPAGISEVVLALFQQSACSGTLQMHDSSLDDATPSLPTRETLCWGVVVMYMGMERVGNHKPRERDRLSTCRRKDTL